MNNLEKLAQQIDDQFNLERESKRKARNKRKAAKRKLKNRK